MKKIGYALAALLVCIALLIVSGVRFDVPVEKLLPKYANGQSKFMTIDGLNVHYRDDGKGYPLLLLHAAPSSLQTFDGVTAELAKQYRVIRLDLPGYGLTGPSAEGDYSVRWYVRFLESFLEALHVQSCCVAGNSLGGRLAVELAYARPALVRKMVLLDADGYPVDDSGVLAMRMARNTLLRPVVRWVTPRFFVAMNLKEVFGGKSPVPEATVDRYYELMLRAGNRDTFIAMSNRKPEDSSGHIRAIKVPTLILWGKADTIFPVSYAERFHRDISGSLLKVYDSVGHMPQELIPDRVAADMLSFFKGGTVR